jgi:hypothetical protein
MDRLSKIFPVRRPGIIIPLFFLLVYLVFPTGFSTTDGWNYAAEIKYSGEFFHPYHLLYNAFGYMFCYFPARAGADILSCLKVMNSFFAAALLYIVRLIIYRLKKDELLCAIICCLSGSSFAIMRFATENETYILPLFFALLASYYFLRFLQTGHQGNAFLTGMLVSFSVMLHITYVVWWLCLLVGMIRKADRKALTYYLIPAFSIPVIYLLVVVSLSGTLSRTAISGFLFNDFTNNSRFELSWKGVFFSVVNLIRSFIQVHGYLIDIIKRNFLYVLPGFISIIFFIVGLFRLSLKRISSKDGEFRTIMIMVAFSQFVLAVISSGNAEFMVMIPVLSFIVLSIVLIEPGKFLVPVMTGMLIWNLAYGIIPLHFNSGKPEQFLSDLALNVKNTKIIASDDQLLKSMIYYRTGIRETDNIYKSPAVIKAKGMDISKLVSVIDKAIAHGDEVYTDCLSPYTLSRASISEGNLNELFFRKYATKEVMTWNTITGRKSVSKVESGIRN